MVRKWAKVENFAFPLGWKNLSSFPKGNSFVLGFYPAHSLHPQAFEDRIVGVSKNTGAARLATNQAFGI